MAENGLNGATTTVRPGMMRTFAALLADRLGLAGRLGWSHGGERNLYDTVGYQRRLEYRDYLARYERQDIAHAVVHAYPDDTWSQPPRVQEDNQDHELTPFEDAWQDLVERLNLYRALWRLDLLANIGHYGVLLLGLRGQSSLLSAAAPVRGPEDLLYLQPYSEDAACVEQLEDDPGQAHYGEPRLYRITTRSGATGTVPAGGREMLVHASRTLHLAEDILEDEIYGIPRLKPMYNRLDDLEKILAFGSEGYARHHHSRIAALLRDGYELNDEDRASYKEQVEKFGMGWTDFLSLGGMDVQEIRGSVASPRDFFDVILSLIAAATGIPKSRLLGAERGTLASAAEESQDWQERIIQRQTLYATPLLRRFIDWCLALGILPQPADPYTIVWANQRALSEPQRAQVAKDKATAISQYDASRVATVNAGIQPTVKQPEFRELVLNLPPESAYPDEPLPERLPAEATAESPRTPAQPALGDQAQPQRAAA